MKSVVLLLKGVLLWVTIFSIFCFIAGGFKSLVEADKWLAAGFWLTINIALGYICYNCLSYHKLYKLSGSKWFDKLLRA